MSHSRGLEVGTTIAERYRVEEVLGEGAAATVYRAHDLTHDREVAIKVLRPEVAVAVGSDRFKREISLSGRLSHPHIVPMLDAGETHGMLFYVMPVIGGKSLRERLAAEHQLPVEDAIQIVRDVAIALDHAHAQGIVHRDIKPDNVLLGGGTAVVTDFGIAKMLGERSTGDSLTRTGMAVGTVLYMSPEQASAGLVDARTDIYALGCLAYEMLAGEPPFMGPTPQSILAKHFTDPVPQVHRLRPTVPAAIDDAIAMAMAKAPADRYAKAMDFANALAVARSTTTMGRLPAAEPPLLLRSAQSTPSRRSRALWLGAAALAVAALGSTLVFRDRLFTPGTPADSARRSIAVLPFEDVSRMRDQEYFGTGIADELLSALTQLPNIRVAARTSSFALRGSNLSPGDIGRRLRVSSLLTGSVRRDGERLRVVAELVDIGPDTVLWHGVFDREVSDVFSVQEDIARAIARNFQAPISDSSTLLKRSTNDPEAYQLYLRGRHGWRTRTAQSLAQAVEYFQQAIALDSNYASAHAGLADTYNVIGLNFYGPPGENFRRAREAAEHAIALDPKLAEAHSALGSAIAFLDRDWDRAEEAFKHAIALDPSYPPSYYFYSIFLANLGRHDSALAIATKARDLDGTSAVMSQGVGIARVMAAQFPQAIMALESTIAIDPNYYFPHAWHAVALARTGAPDSALSEVHRAMQLAPENVLVRTFHGQVHALVGQRDSATAIAHELEALRGARAVPNVMVARLYAIMGDTANALAALERGLAQNEAQLAQLRVPGFESLYLHPRFEAILRQLKLN